jgi:hypothetical protein
MTFETNISGIGSAECCEKDKNLKYQVLQSPKGYYLGTACTIHGPWSRESDYFQTHEEAQTALDAFCKTLPPTPNPNAE